MEKRKWLWRKKSSLDEETEASESMSSQSEKFSEEQESTKGSPNDDPQSPEVTSKASEEECNRENTSISKNSLLNKLSEAKQEESVAGNFSKPEPISDMLLNQEGKLLHDKDEDESVKLLKEKLSAALINVSLKDELVKQHSKVAEEAVEGWEKAENEVSVLKQELETAAANNLALEAKFSDLDRALKECVRQLRLAKDDKSELETRIDELQAQLQSSCGISSEVQMKLEFLERENKRVSFELVAQSEELEIRTIERDLSTKAAEMASKQHLESIKMVAKLESECRKLKAISRKLPVLGNGHKPPLASSYSMDLATKNEKTLGRDIDLMDDFLEMEKLAALPEDGHQSKDEENLLREELEMIKCREAELEVKLRKMEDEKVGLMEAKMKMELLEQDLQEANELKMDYESYANDLNLEAQAMVSKIKQLEEQVDWQRVSSEELSDRCQELENALRLKSEELEEMEKALKGSKNKLLEVEMKYEEAVMKFEKQENASRVESEEKEVALAESRKCLEEMQVQMKAENAVYESEVEERKTALARNEECLNEMRNKLKEGENKVEELQKELHELTEAKERLLIEVDTLRTQIDERISVSDELVAKCEKLEKELKRKEDELEVQQTVPFVIEPKLKEEDLASAAGKFEECQKTISSIGTQLKSLASLEDFLIDASPVVTNGGDEMWKLHSSNVYLPQKRSDDQFHDPEEKLHTFSKYVEGDLIQSSSSTMFSSSSEKRGNGCEKLFPMRKFL